ncbi:16S rRNA (adenine(1518)-N(6)/adenine(1519)-N(6))-dimethyltransferase RsmA [Boudabousia marimammalium]|uniref:Ribosomal RNA small subunit methyltransferase A n=1 Tax=Boudabousia marimammalium TaxID=156892 RepID=A0A1Q5PRV8_9ACTO|nr:16S rRNA (adenine(1518)-N(6)/adenine(1519)-N(6))-dimethyltransferase RsmA [Boudabousia marimammalium]OKL50296.1 16S rRNA (adenine(1518)-N(6)/adenine(1519)-N(6))-dimethyltransferase [Boudabousia marimammalium]
MELLTTAHVRELCEHLNIRPTKTLGQNFVHDAGTVRRIVREAQVETGEHVLEVGPGLGSLTLALLEAGAHVTAVEIDPALASALPQTVKAMAGEQAANLRVLKMDAMKVTSPQLLDSATEVVEGAFPVTAAPTKLVANLPYNVAVPVLLILLEALPSIQEVLVMVQSEVANRLAAGPGSRTYGVPSVKVQWYGKARTAGAVSRNVFWPTPHVDSALVRISRYTEGGPAVSDQEVSREEVFAAVDAAFSQRRKTLRSALANWAGSPQDAARIAEAAGVDVSLRGERLVINDFIALARAKKQIEN